MDIEMFSFSFPVTCYQHLIRMSGIKIQYDGTYVLVDAIKIISLRIEKSSALHVLLLHSLQILTP